jgi:hypothetical protein
MPNRQIHQNIDVFDEDEHDVDEDADMNIGKKLGKKPSPELNSCLQSSLIFSCWHFYNISN